MSYKNALLRRVIISLLLGITVICPVFAENISSMSSSQAFYQCAKHEFDINDLKSAIVNLNRAIQLNPHFAHAFYLRACCKHLQRDYRGALADSSEAIRIAAPVKPIYYFQKGIAEFRLNMLDDAIADFSQSMMGQPDFLGNYIYRGHCRVLNGDKAAALSDYEAASRLRPDDDEVIKLKHRIDNYMAL